MIKGRLVAAKRIITIYVKVINEGQMETVQNYVNNYKCNVSYFDEAINYWNCNVYVKESVFRQSLWWKGYDIMSFKNKSIKERADFVWLCKWNWKWKSTIKHLAGKIIYVLNSNILNIKWNEFFNPFNPNQFLFRWLRFKAIISIS